MKAVHCFLYALILSICLPILALAENDQVLKLSRQNAPYKLAGFTAVHIETDKPESAWEDRMVLADLVALPDSDFSPVTTRQIGFGWTNAIIHARTHLQNPTDQEQTWVLGFNQTPWGKRLVYLVIDGHPLPTKPIFVFPDVAPWQDQDRFLHTEFVMPAMSSGTLYVSYANASSSAPMTIELPEDYESKRLLKELQIYVLLGLVLGVMVLTVSLLGVLHQHVAVFYALYLASAIMHLCYVIDLFPFVSLLSDYIYPIMRFWWAAFAMSFYLLFQRAYFTKHPGIRPALRQALLLAAIVLMVLTFAYDHFSMPFVVLIIWSSLCIVFIAANGVLAIVKRVTGRWFFAAGCLVLTLMVVPMNLSDFMTAHYTYEEAATVFLYGLVFEAIALSGAMFSRVREIRAEKEQALAAELESTKQRLSMSRKLATAAHDIQQPLGSLKMLMTQNGDAANTQKNIGGAIDYLDEIVRKQLTDTKHAFDNDEVSGAFDEQLDLGFLFENLHAMFAAEAEEKGLKFRIVPTDKQTSANAFALMRVTSNLISNAIKNTAAGGVLVGSRSRNGRICVEIYDTGPGLQPEQFEQLKAPYEREGKYDGQGLGLSIVDQLCRENDFDLQVLSEPNQGTRFQIWLPNHSEET